MLTNNKKLRNSCTYVKDSIFFTQAVAIISFVMKKRAKQKHFHECALNYGPHCMHCVKNRVENMMFAVYKRKIRRDLEEKLVELPDFSWMLTNWFAP